MQELMDKIVRLVTAAGGSLPYTDLLDGVTYQERSKIVSALRNLEKAGIARRRIGSAAVDGAVTHNIVLEGGE